MTEDLTRLHYIGPLRTAEQQLEDVHDILAARLEDRSRAAVAHAGLGPEPALRDPLPGEECITDAAISGLRKQAADLDTGEMVQLAHSLVDSSRQLVGSGKFDPAETSERVLTLLRAAQTLDATRAWLAGETTPGDDEEEARQLLAALHTVMFEAERLRNQLWTDTVNLLEEGEQIGGIASLTRLYREFEIGNPLGTDFDWALWLKRNGSPVLTKMGMNLSDVLPDVFPPPRAP